MALVAQSSLGEGRLDRQWGAAAPAASVWAARDAARAPAARKETPPAACKPAKDLSKKLKGDTLQVAQDYCSPVPKG